MKSWCRLFLIFVLMISAGCSEKQSVQYSVSFDTRGGQQIMPVMVDKNHPIEVEDPVREGYTFEGWYSSPDLSAKWDKNDKVTEDTVLYASWSKQTRTISFETNGADPIEPITLKYGESFSMPSLTISKEGYGFQGWFYDRNFTNPYSGSFEVTEDVTFYAEWKELTYAEIKVMNLISQKDYGMVNGTEAASLLMALQSAGHALDYNFASFVKNIPYSTDGTPVTGFAGDPWADTEQIDGILPEALETWANNYGSAKNISGCEMEDLIGCILEGHPVVVWLTNAFQATQPVNYPWGAYKTNVCVMTLYGYDEGNNSFLVADPTGRNDGLYWVSYKTFQNVWTVYPGAVEIW